MIHKLEDIPNILFVRLNGIPYTHPFGEILGAHDFGGGLPRLTQLGPSGTPFFIHKIEDMQEYVLEITLKNVWKSIDIDENHLFSDLVNKIQHDESYILVEEEEILSTPLETTVQVSSSYK